MFRESCRCLSAIGLAACIVITLAVEAQAGSNDRYKVAIHVLPRETRTCTSNMPAVAACSDITTTFASCGDIDVFPVFFGLTEVTGAQFGLTWPQQWGSCAWTYCADFAIGDIVVPGDGIAQTFATCHPTWSWVVGFGWLTAGSQGMIRIIPNPATGLVSVADCSFFEDEPVAIFDAGVCGVSGDDPCETIYLPLSLTKSDGLGPLCVEPGETFTYTVTYENAENTAAVHNVVLTDHLSPQVEFLSATSGALYDSFEHVVTWTIGVLGAGESGSENLGVRVLPDTPAPTTLANTCEISCDEAPGAQAEENTEVCVKVQAPLNLAKDDGLGWGCANPDENVYFTITYDNYANSDSAIDVVLTDSLAAEVSFVVASGGGSYHAASHTVVWPLGALAPGEDGTQDLVVLVNPGTPAGSAIVNHCRIGGVNTPMTIASESTLVCGIYLPLNLAKDDGLGGSCASPGELVDYIISFDNTTNTEDVRDVVLTDYISDYAEFVSAGGGGAYDPETHSVTWTLPILGQGQSDSRSLGVQLRTDLLPGTGVENTCRIAAAETPPCTSSVTSTVCGETCPLGLRKDDDVIGCVSYSEIFTYGIGYDNASNPFAVQNVILTDFLDVSTRYIYSTPTGAYDAPTHSLTWQHNSLGSGETHQVVITVAVRQGAQPGEHLVNRCRIVSDQTLQVGVLDSTLVCSSGFSPLNIQKNDGVASCVNPGYNIRYVICYDNSTNTSQVNNVVLTDYLPVWTNFVSATGNGSYEDSSHTVTWLVGSLEPGAGGSDTVTARVKSDAGGGLTMVNTARIMSDETPTAEALEYTGICGSYHERNATHKIAIHVMEHESRTCSKNFPTIQSCSDIEFTFPQCADIDVFAVFFDLSNVTAVQHGLTWPSEWYSCAYTKCAGDLTIGDILNPGDGVAYSWFECQYVQTVVAGYGWLRAGTPGKICIAVNPTTGAVGTSNCDFVEDFPLVMFCGGACGELGDDPCTPTRIVPTTWGSIKAMFR